MKKYLIYIIVLIFCFACRNVEKQPEGVIVHIDINQSEKHTISECIDSIGFIRLQTLDDNIIQQVTKIYFDDQKLIIFDRPQKQVLIFNEDGTFVNKIKHVGQGPGEYVSLDVGLYDPIDKKVIIYDYGKLLHYTLDGTLLKERSQFNDNALIRDMINLPNGNLLCYTYDFTPEKVGENASGLWEVDAGGTFIRSIFTIEDLYPVVMNFENSHFQLLSGNRVMLRDAQFNDLYYLENDQLTKVISYKIKNDILPELKGYTHSEDSYIKSLTAQEKNNYIFTAWTDKNNVFYTIYNKKTEKNTVVYPASVLWQSDDVVEPTSSRLIDHNRSDVLITFLSGMTILDYLRAESGNQDIKNKLKQLTQGMSEQEIMDMNPVLQLLYLKKE